MVGKRFRPPTRLDVLHLRYYIYIGISCVQIYIYIIYIYIFIYLYTYMCVFHIISVMHMFIYNIALFCKYIVTHI
jgi:hypothetical protein